MFKINNIWSRQKHAIESTDGGNVIHILQDQKWNPFEVVVLGKRDATYPTVHGIPDRSK